MSFAINILALLLVLGLCWMAMMWLSGRFHGHGAGGRFADDYERDIMTGLPVELFDDGVSCPVCEGVGATQERGKLRPCHECQGTGVRG
ncbi:MAG: hypothetical protein AAF567_21250 [Actinomycetota bacterium]